MNIKEFKKLDLNKIQLIDIREKEEFKTLPKIPQAIHIPKDELIDNMSQINMSRPVYLICRTGSRTDFMAIVLQNMWYNTISIEWGIEAYLNNNKQW